MHVFIFPLRYLWLTDEDHRPLFLRNALAVLVLTVLLSLPFWLGNANYFSSGGFLDRFGGFAGVLTGFYVAALVGIASFAGISSTLDEPIELGPILERKGSEEPEKLSRRQYVCAMFGYLSFVALMLAMVALVLVATADTLGPQLATWVGGRTTRVADGVLLFVINLVLAHMIATTCHGLYYLIDRLYAQKAVLLPKPAAPDEE